MGNADAKRIAELICGTWGKLSCIDDITVVKAYLLCKEGKSKRLVIPVVQQDLAFNLLLASWTTQSKY